MRRVFLDTSALFSAFYSPTGAARDVLHLVFAEHVKAVISDYIVKELKRNLAGEAPTLVPFIEELITALNAEITPKPTSRDVEKVMPFVPLKDAPVVAAAIVARPDYFVTYDRKHFLNNVRLKEMFGLSIVTPDVVVTELTKESA